MSDITEMPGSTTHPEPRVKRETNRRGPLVPVFNPPAQFPEDATRVLKRAKISKKQFSKYAEQFTLFLLTHCSADFAISLQKSIRQGDRTGMEMFAKLTGMLKNESGVTVNLSNNLAISAGGGGSNREVDGLIRMLDERDRHAAIDVTPMAQPLIEASGDDEEE